MYIYAQFPLKFMINGKLYLFESMYIYVQFPPKFMINGALLILI